MFKKRISSLHGILPHIPSLLILTLPIIAAHRAHAVSWATGSNSGNWIALSPTSAEVGIGTSTSTNPAEKLTVAAGNVLVDNNRYYKGKTTGGVLSNLIGINTSNALSLYDGKLTVGSDGRTFMGNATVGGDLAVAGTVNVKTGANLNGPTLMTGMVTASNHVLINGNVGIGTYLSDISKLYVEGNSAFRGRVNVTVGPIVAEAGLTSLGDFEAKNASVLENVTIRGNLSVFGSKNFVQPHPTDETKKIVYVAAEAGEALTMARGISKTENGSVVVNLPDHFALVTSEEAPVTVQLTVEGAPALVYIVSKSKQSIEVKMKDSDYREFSDVTFHYFVQGVRDGFEDHLAIQDISAESDAAHISPKRKRYQDRVIKATRGMKQFQRE